MRRRRTRGPRQSSCGHYATSKWNSQRSSPTAKRRSRPSRLI